MTIPRLDHEANSSGMRKDTKQMKGFNHCMGIRFIIAGLIWLLAVSIGTAAESEYDVHLSWFIEMGQFDDSGHNYLFCVDCHKSVVQQSQHPAPENIKRKASYFFNEKTCAGTDCHENTFEDYEKGVHGRIRFENREKYANCIDCHDPHTVQVSESKKSDPNRKPVSDICNSINTETQPAGCKSNAECLECHSLPEDKVAAVEKESELCFHCHSQSGEFAKLKEFGHIPKINTIAYHKTSHARDRCTDCHSDSATYGHEKTTQDCKNCHTPHAESENHDAHVGVECRACHLQGNIAVNSEKESIVWQSEWAHPDPVSVHLLVDTEDEASCIRCHTSGNKFGAAAMILPAKGVFCMACHTATFTASDTTSLITLLMSLLISLGLLSLWLSAGPATIGKSENNLKVSRVLRDFGSVFFSKRIGRVLKALLLDAVLQRKLFFQSPYRWFSHGLVFYAFLLRFSLGLVSLILSLAFPEWPLSMALLDKNQPLVAFVFDITGVLIILGMVLMVIRKVRNRKISLPGLPQQEWLSMVLIGGIILVGFVLEGMRISMTLDYSDKHFAFLGYTVSLLFNQVEGLTAVYGYIWYLHALLTAAFVIGLPFSRMFHIVMVPIAIAVNAAQPHKK